MDPAKTLEEDNMSTISDVGDLGLNYNADAMSDGEVQSELADLIEVEGEELNTTVIECSVPSSETNPATPKLKLNSVVVKQVSSNRSNRANRNNHKPSKVPNSSATSQRN